MLGTIISAFFGIVAIGQSITNQSSGWLIIGLIWIAIATLAAIGHFKWNYKNTKRLI